MRSSGLTSKDLFHRNVLDPLLHEARPALHVTIALVQREGVGLGVERDAVRAAVAGDAIGFAKNGAGHTSPTLVRLHGQPAEPRDATAEEEPAGADHPAVLDRHQMGGLVVAAVAVGLERDPLLAAEDPLAQLERGVKLLLRAYRPDVQDQRA